MNDILRELENVIEKYKDKTFFTGELNFVEMAKSCKIEIQDLLQEKAERENPKPLTLEEIKAIKKPIPLYKKLLTNETGEYIGANNEWWDVCCGITEASGVIYWRSGHTNNVSDYGKIWIAYYHEPKEATDDR